MPLLLLATLSPLIHIDVPYAILIAVISLPQNTGEGLHPTSGPALQELGRASMSRILSSDMFAPVPAQAGSSRGVRHARSLGLPLPTLE